MAKKITVYDILISCPSDVSEYVNLLEKQITTFNSFYGRSNDVIVRCSYWMRDTYSEFGDSPQELVNKQIVDSSDMIVAVFWTRFGTETEHYGSGTEEEIERMLSMKKQVFLYFLDKPVSLSQVDFEQYAKIQQFMEKHKNEGIFFSVPDEDALSKKFLANLMLYFDSIIHGPEVKKSVGKKAVLWVDDRPENNVFERNALEQYGIEFTLALSTQQALNCMKHDKFSLVISDMARKEGSQEGYALLESVRKIDEKIPYIIFSSADKEECIEETLNRGGQGYTNNSNELIDLVIKNLLNS